MGKPLRVLMIEDFERDEELLLRHLRRGGFEVAHRRVETADQIREALRAGRWDVIVCDYVLPHLDAPGALAVCADCGCDTPFIVVSGTINEEIAVHAMKSGAYDFLLKSNLGRLSLVVDRALSEADARAERARAAQRPVEAPLADEADEIAGGETRRRRLAIESAVSGVTNREGFVALLTSEVRRARRKGDSLAVLRCDLDFFRTYTDRYGADGGAACVREVGALLAELFSRAGDVVAHLDAEEFAVALPGCTPQEAVIQAERFRRAVEEMAMAHELSPVAPHVTVSVGAVGARADGEHDATWFLARAEEALRESMDRGRNCVTGAVAAPATVPVTDAPEPPTSQSIS